MQESELVGLIQEIQKRKTKTARIEFKSAKEGTPEKLYDTLSSFSNTSAGVILFGIDEKSGYAVCGVKSPDVLGKKLSSNARRWSRSSGRS